MFIFSKYGIYNEFVHIYSIHFHSSVNDKVVVSRSCSWEDASAPADTCLKANTPSYIRTEFCESCTHDGCNGAGQFGAAAVMVLLPVLLAKLLLW